MSPGQFCLKLVWRIDRGIDGATGVRFCIANGLNYLGEGHIADHQKIQIAFRPFLSTSNRAKNESYNDAARKRRECVSQDSCRADDFCHQTAKFFVRGARLVCLKVNMSAFPASPKDAPSAQTLYLSLHLPHSQPRPLRNLAKVEFAVRMAE